MHSTAPPNTLESQSSFIGLLHSHTRADILSIPVPCQASQTPMRNDLGLHSRPFLSFYHWHAYSIPQEDLVNYPVGPNEGFFPQINGGCRYRRLLFLVFQLAYRALHSRPENTQCTVDSWCGVCDIAAIYEEKNSLSRLGITIAMPDSEISPHE